MDIREIIRLMRAANRKAGLSDYENSYKGLYSIKERWPDDQDQNVTANGLTLQELGILYPFMRPQFNKGKDFTGLNFNGDGWTLEIVRVVGEGQSLGKDDLLLFGRKELEVLKVEGDTVILRDRMTEQEIEKSVGDIKTCIADGKMRHVPSGGLFY